MLKDITTGELERCNVTFWCGEKENVLYRRQFFSYDLKRETHWIQAMNLADFTVPYGIIRVDKMRFHRRPVALTLGAYGFPDNGTEIVERTNKDAKAIILKGTDFTGKEKQLAMTIFWGFSSIDYMRSIGTNPDSEKSIIVYAATKRKKQYGSYEPYLLISQVITKESHEEFTEEELFPVESINCEDSTRSGAYGTTTITLKDGTVRVINFEGIEGKMSL